MKKATIKDVAQAAGVSISLVSKIVNAPRRADGSPDCKVRPETSRRVMDAIRTLGYRPNRAAASLRKGKENRIGIVIPDISNRFFADVSREIENFASESGYTVIFGSSDENSDKFGKIIDSFASDGVDGIIAVPCCDCENHVKRAADQGIPVVIMVRDIPELHNIGKVLNNNRKASNLALDHLVESGYKSIEMVSPSLRLSNVKEREELYLEYMNSHNLGRFARVNHLDDKRKEESMSFILEDLIRRKVDAAYFPSASLPLLFLSEAQSKSVSIPEEIAVIGYDGGRDYSLTSPTLSQIIFSQKEMADAAFNLLKTIMSGKPVPEQPTLLEPSLKVGHSTTKVQEATTGTTQGKQQAQCTNKEIISSLKEAIKNINKTINTLTQNEQ